MSLLRANVLGYGIAFAALPFLTRLFSPTDFGVLGLFTAVSGILLSFATYRFDWSIPNARTNAAAAGLLAWGFIALVVVIALISIALMTGLPAVVIGAFGSDELVRESFLQLGFLVPLAVLGVGVSELLRGWRVRENELSSVGKSSVIQRIFDSMLGVFGGLAGLGVIALLGAYVISFWAGTIVLMLHAAGLWRALRRLSPRKMRWVVSRFFKEASWSTTVSFVNASSHALPLILISSFYSIKETGWYALVYRVALAPMMLITLALSKSYWAHAAKLYKSGDIKELNAHYLLTTRRLAIGAIPITLGCALGPFLVGPVFGQEEWGGAGYMLLALAPVLIGIFVFSPTNHLVALRQPATQLIADSVRVGMVLAALIVSDVLGWNVYIAVALSSTASLIGYLFLYYLHLREHKKYE